VGDFAAGAPPVPLYLNTWSQAFNGTAIRSVAVAGAAASSTWVANAAIYVPFFVPWAYPVARAFWCNGSSAAANVDIGIYGIGGAQLWHSGSTAQVAANNLQFVSAGVLLSPGPYLLALACSGTTNALTANTVITTDFGRLMGYYQQASAFPLPAPATFAAYAGVGLPLMGITTKASGF
jgi:hypothetical protein